VTFKTGLVVAAVLIPLQILAGDFHGLNTLEHQPQKVAAMEANWETQRAVPLVLFAIPDEVERTNHFELAVPSLASLILTHDLDGEVPGLNDFPGDHPPVAPLFFGFRLMVGVGLLMLLVSWTGVVSAYRTGSAGPVMRKVVIAMTFSGWVATLAGWYVTEIGRQPWLVTGVLTTAEAVTTVPAGRVGLSLALYAITYVGLLVAYIHTLFYMARQSVTVEEYETAATVDAMSNTVPVLSGGRSQT
jgi:cytochrome d ubiquinol oxidase subunit I